MAIQGLIKNIEQSEVANLKKHKPAKDAPPASNDVEEFKRAYDEFWLNTVDESRFVEADGFHPSSLGVEHGKCVRYHYYMLSGVRKENTFNARLLRILHRGNTIHEMMQKNLEDMKVLRSAEIPIEWNDPPIKGHCDGVISYNGRIILIEIKSISGAGFDQRVQWKRAKPEHLLQAYIYAYILKIDIIWIVYYNKATEEIEIFEYPANKEVAEKQIKKWKKWYQVWQDGELPKRPFKIDSPACSSCPLAKHCYSDPTPCN